MSNVNNSVCVGVLNLKDFQQECSLVDETHALIDTDRCMSNCMAGADIIRHIGPCLVGLLPLLAVLHLVSSLNVFSPQVVSDNS